MSIRKRLRILECESRGGHYWHFVKVTQGVHDREAWWHFWRNPYWHWTTAQYGCHCGATKQKSLTRKEIAAVCTLNMPADPGIVFTTSLAIRPVRPWPSPPSGPVGLGLGPGR